MVCHSNQCLLDLRYHDSAYEVCRLLECGAGVISSGYKISMVDASRSYESRRFFTIRHGLTSQNLVTFPFEVQLINSAKGCRRFLLCELSELPKHSVGSKCELSLVQLGVEYLVKRAA